MNDVRNGENGGRMVSRYVLRERIGSGGMSTVWLAREKDSEEDLAIKVIPIEDLNPDFERRLRREPEIHRNLQHDNIVRLIDWFREGDEFFLVMEYVEGESLSAMIKRRGAIPFIEARDLMRGVLRAVAHLHQHDVIHRDIKPANILIRPGGEAVLTDFGIAKFGWQQGETKTQAGLGTPEYMSPEQVQGSSIDYRTDIWSLGITLFEMLTGQKPFARGEETPAEYAGVIGRILAGELPDPRKYHRTIPDGALGVIRTATARNRDERFSSAAEFLGALEVVDPRLITPWRDEDATVVLQNRPTAEPSTGATVIPGQEVNAPPPQAAAPPPPAKRSGSTGLLVVLFLLLVAAGGYVAWKSSNGWDGGERPSGGLTEAEALGIARGLASEFERHSFDGDIGSLTSLYAPSGVNFYRLQNVGRREIADDYGTFFSQIVRTDQLVVTVQSAQPLNDSSLISRWRVRYAREKEDGTLLRGVAIIDVTISWVGDAWLITGERQIEVSRNDVAPLPPPDTTGLEELPDDLPDVDSGEMPDIEELEEPVVPTGAQMKERFSSIVRGLNNGEGSAAWEGFISSELKGRLGGITEALGVGNLSIRSMSTDGSTLTATVATGDPENASEFRLRLTFGDGPDMKIVSVTPLSNN